MNKIPIGRVSSGTITVGAVTTGEPGSAASVTNSGTETAAVLDFSIPRGERGQPGITAPLDGFFTVYVDETGNLLVMVPDGGVSPLHLDENNDLIFTIQ